MGASYLLPCLYGEVPGLLEEVLEPGAQRVGYEGALSICLVSFYRHPLSFMPGFILVFNLMSFP